MFRISVIIFSLLALCAQAAIPDSLDQINADLLAKKAKAEPFKDKDVKVDLESLGLDEIDAKDAKIAAENAPEKPAPVVNTLTAEDLPDPKKTEIKKSQLIAPTKEEKSVAPIVTMEDKIREARKKIKVESPATSKAENSINDKSDKDAQKAELPTEVKAAPGVEAAPTVVTPSEINKNSEQNSVETVATKKESKAKEAYINSQKKQNLKKQLAAKKAAKKKAEENEKKRKEKLKKLNQLREKYLIKINTDKSLDSKILDEDLSDIDEKIIPQKKDINKFVSYERPAPPILDRYRNRENQGIPIVISRKEKADILFRSIGQEDISFFNSAYNDIEDPNLRNDVGDTILTYAILLQKREVVASILARGADPDLPNKLGYTPLQITLESLDIASFNLVVNGGADINAVDGFGRTPLMHAARLGFLAAIDILIKKGADVNALDYDGFNALAIANKYQQDLAVTLLLKNGAKPWVEKPYDPESESLIKQLDNKWRR